MWYRTPTCPNHTVLMTDNNNCRCMIIQHEQTAIVYAISASLIWWKTPDRSEYARLTWSSCAVGAHATPHRVCPYQYHDHDRMQCVHTPP